MRLNANHQRPIKDWSWDIIKSRRWLFRQPAHAEHLMYTPQGCFKSDTPPKYRYTEMHTADWRWETQVSRDSRGYKGANRGKGNAQTGGYSGSHDLHVRQNTSLEFCWRQERVACVCDNWQSIFEDPPDALNAHHRNGCSLADSNQEPQYPSDVAGWAVANKQRGAEWSTPAGTPAYHL